ncbi:hypothetical protein [Bifidobacterium ramosum]|uniref:Uncharacterized protein n=1 Tax=Bifidobacterium ramosum TaxID=1798158 RepID=A0A7K3TA91_9BIFI|nr:hypothetical protein [Bifidobacterium ramosum]NEG71382.1 hypothetical protein [Bifidobacterium ramosum]
MTERTVSRLHPTPYFFYGHTADPSIKNGWLSVEEKKKEERRKEEKKKRRRERRRKRSGNTTASSAYDDTRPSPTDNQPIPVPKSAVCT